MTRIVTKSGQSNAIAELLLDIGVAKRFVAETSIKRAAREMHYTERVTVSSVGRTGKWEMRKTELSNSA